jgi:pilus assembly protein CpaB
MNMKKNEILRFLGIGLIVAIVATGIFYGLFVNRLTSSPGTGKTLVVAARPLKAGTQLQTADLKTIPWPAQQLPAGFYGTVDQVTGTTVFDPIGEGEPVVTSHLATATSVGGVGIPEGMRAVSIHITDSTGVLALLRAGQKVDVQVVVRQKETTQVRTALEDLTVLSVQAQSEASSQGVVLPVVTLLAKPADADILAWADSGARVRVTLRNPLDEGTRSRAPLSQDTIMRVSGTDNTSTGAVIASTQKPQTPSAALVSNSPTVTSLPNPSTGGPAKP